MPKWEDAPVVDSGNKPKWESAPEVSPVSSGPVTNSAGIPGSMSGKPVPVPEVTKTDNTILGKVRNAFDTVAEPAMAMGTGILAAPVSSVYGAGKEILSGELGKGTGQKYADEAAKAMTYQPRNPNARDVLERIGNSELMKNLGGINPSVAMEMNALASPSISQAGKIAGNAGKAISSSPEADVLRQGVSKLGGALTPKIDPEIARLAKKAQDMGVSVNLDMLTNNNPAKVFGKTLREIPLSGSNVEKNRTAFNRAIIKTFGGDVKEERITPKVFEEAMTRHGKTIGDVSKKYPIPDDPALRQFVDAQIKGLAKETPDVASVVTGYIDDIRSKIANGEINGETFRKLRSELGQQLRSTTNGDLKRALSSLDEGMLDTIERNIKNPQDLKEFNEARHFYYNGKLVEPLIAKAATKGGGNMSPAAYSNVISNSKPRKTQIAMGRGGEPVDISAVGSKFLVEPGSSNTAEKALAYSMLGGGGLAAAAPGAAGVWTGANVYNRLGPLLAKKIVNAQKAMKKAGKIEARADGGPVVSGKPYLVGEKGPEIVVPPADGTVIPTNKAKALLGAGGDGVSFQTHRAMKEAGLEGQPTVAPVAMNEGVGTTGKDSQMVLDWKQRQQMQQFHDGVQLLMKRGISEPVAQKMIYASMHK